MNKEYYEKIKDKRNIKLVLEYNGSKFYGFQKQKEKRTIEKAIEECIFEVFNENVIIRSCGRTDRGVHAKCHVLNFFVNKNKNIEINNVKKALNLALKKLNYTDIAIISAEDKDVFFDSNLDCKEKTYIYCINTSYESAINKDFEYFLPIKLNISKMKIAAKYLIGQHDFTSFKKVKSDEKKTNIRNIYNIEIKKLENRIIFKITGDGFLYNMVRIIVGTLVDIGKNKIEPEEIINILKAKDRKKAGKTLPAHGLMLLNVKY